GVSQVEEPVRLVDEHQANGEEADEQAVQQAEDDGAGGHGRATGPTYGPPPTIDASGSRTSSPSPDVRFVRVRHAGASALPGCARVTGWLSSRRGQCRSGGPP